MYNFILNLQFIFRPTYWMMNYKYSKEWNITLNELLDNHRFTNIDEHHAQLGPALIWISNVPYGCMCTDPLFTKHSTKEYSPKYQSVRPSKLTILRCLKRLKQDVKTIEQIRDEKLNKLLGFKI